MEQAPRFTKGNDKLRKKAVSDWRPNSRRRHIRVFNFNLRAIHTCPGRTFTCESYCYADAGRYRMLRDAHDANRTIADEKRGVIERTENLPAGAWLRIHTSGDFYSAEYTHKWRIAAALRPDVMFWAFTRSWSVARILPSLERLRALPNVQLFASVDVSTVGAPPPDWRIAYLKADTFSPAATTRKIRARELRYMQAADEALTCPEQTGDMADCLDCGFCILAKRGNVGFIQH